MDHGFDLAKERHRFLTTGVGSFLNHGAELVEGVAGIGEAA